MDQSHEPRDNPLDTKKSLSKRFNNAFNYFNGKVESARTIPLVGPTMELISDLLSYDPQGPGNTGQKDLLLRKGLITPILELPFKAVVDTVDLLKEFHILVANPSKLIFSKHQKIESIKSIVKVIISIPSIIVHFAIMLAITTLEQSKTLINRVGILLHNLTNLGLIIADGADDVITIDNRLTMPLVYMKATYNPLVFLFNVVSFAINTAIVMPINLLGYFVNLLPIVPRSKATHSQNSLDHQRRIDFRYINASVGLDLHTGDKILNESKLYALKNIKPESGFVIEKLQGLFKQIMTYALETTDEKKAEKRKRIVNFIKPLIRSFALTVAAVFAPVTLAYRILANQPEWNDKLKSIGGVKAEALKFAAPLTGLSLLYSLTVRTGKIFSDVPVRHVDTQLKSQAAKNMRHGLGKFIHVVRHVGDNFLSMALPLYNNGDSHGQLPSESKVMKSDKASFWKQSTGRNTELSDPLMNEDTRVENQDQKDFQPSI